MAPHGLKGCRSLAPSRTTKTDHPIQNCPLIATFCAYGNDVAKLEDKMKRFECGSLVPGCTWHTEAEEPAEVVRRAAEHLRNAHDEAIIRPGMVDLIKDRIRDVAAQPR